MIILRIMGIKTTRDNSGLFFLAEDKGGASALKASHRGLRGIKGTSNPPFLRQFLAFSPFFLLPFSPPIPLFFPPAENLG